LREQIGAPGTSDDELLLRYFAGADEVAALRAAPAPTSAFAPNRSLLALIESLVHNRGHRQIYIKREDFSLRLECRSDSSSGQAREVGA
jgi:hypothetical protein